MPPAIAAVVAAVFAAGGAAIAGASVAAVIAIGVVTLGLGLISQALAPKPKSPSIAPLSSTSRDRTLLIRSSVEAHRIIYGQAMVSGPLVAAFSTGSQNNILFLVVPLAGHQVQEIGDVYFNDLISTDARFVGKFQISKNLGSEEQFVDDVIGDPIPEWTSSHRLRGIAYLTVELVWDQNVWVNGVPNIKAVVKGKKVWDPRAATVNVTSSSVANPTLITCGSAHGLAVGDQVYIKGHAGSTPKIDGEYEVLSTPLTTTFTIRVNVTVGGTGGTISKMVWTPNASLCQLDWLAGALGIRAASDKIHTTSWIAAANISEEQVTLGDDSDAFAADPATDELTITNPTVPFDLGDRVRLTTTGTLPAGLATATDYFVIPVRKSIGAYVLKLGTSLANAIAGTAINVTGAGSGTHTITRKSQARYLANGVVFTDHRPIDIMEDLLTASAGTMVYQQGTYRGYAGAYVAPTVTLTNKDLRGEIRVQTKRSRQEVFNAVKGVFVDQLDFWQPKDFPPVTNATYEAEDGGIRLFHDLELPFTTDIVRCQRLAKIILERSRQDIIVHFPAKLTAFQIAPWDTVMQTNSQLGFSSKVFRVLSWNLATDAGVDLTMQEEASTAYDWSAGQETLFDPAPNTTLPSQFIGSATHVIKNMILQTDLEAPGTKVIIHRADEITMDNGERVPSWIGLTADITQSGAGGLDTGSPVNSRWYRIVALFNPTTLGKALTLHLEKRNVKDQEQASVNASTALRDASARTRLAQGFKVSAAGTLRYVTIKGVVLNGSPSGKVWFTIEADSSGSPSGTPLATSDKLQIQTSMAAFSDWQMWLFRNPPSLQQPAQYWLVMHGDYAINGSDYIFWPHSTANPYANGTQATFDGSVWTAVSANDFVFQAYMVFDDAAVILPSGYTRSATIGYVYRKSDGTFKTFMAQNKRASFSGVPADFKVGSIETLSFIDLSAMVPPASVSFWVAGTNTVVDSLNRVASAPEGYTVGNPALAMQKVEWASPITSDSPAHLHGTVHIEDHQRAYASEDGGQLRLYVPSWEWV